MDILTLTTERTLTRIGVGADIGVAIGAIREAGITAIVDTSTGRVIVTAGTAIAVGTPIEVGTAPADMAAEDSSREAVVSAAAAILAVDLPAAADVGVNR
jgi:hypothetical protein